MLLLLQKEGIIMHNDASLLLKPSLSVLSYCQHYIIILTTDDQLVHYCIIHQQYTALTTFHSIIKKIATQMTHIHNKLSTIIIFTGKIYILAPLSYHACTVVLFFCLNGLFSVLSALRWVHQETCGIAAAGVSQRPIQQHQSKKCDTVYPKHKGV